MQNVGKILLKAIIHGYWCKIEYVNKGGETTNFMIAVKDIYPNKKLLNCDAFNVVYNYNTEERSIYFAQIKNIELHENATYDKPLALIEKIRQEPELYNFLDATINKDDLLDYYRDCFKLDTIPYISKYGLIPGIDDDTVIKDGRYHLNEEQFKILADNNFYKEERKKAKKDSNKNRCDDFLCMNIISVTTKKGLYVLAYRDLLLNIKDKTLEPNTNIRINKEFIFSADDGSISSTESIYKYLPEEEYELINEENIDTIKLLDVLHKYNDTRNSTYAKETKFDNRPFIIGLSKRYTIDIDKEIREIKELANSSECPLPLQVFFGSQDIKLTRRQNYPIFTVNDKYDVSQINAIYTSMRSPVSYIQGPPGTGKTQTLLNAILTAQFNGKTILVSSNNNIPMDGVYEDILALKYKDHQLLFPAIRLGSNENIIKAIERIKEMYEIAKGLKPQESLIKKIKSERKNDMADLVAYLDKYDEYTELKENLDSLNFIIRNDEDSMFSINLQDRKNSLESKLKAIGEISEEEFSNYMKIDYFHLFMAIHFETAAKLQLLKKEKYKNLYNIIFMDNKTSEEIKKQIYSFREFLSNAENLNLFLDIFPVIISTNLSCTYLGPTSQNFDMVMMDEAGQCNIVNSLIPIARGKQLLLIGDPQQLKPVILLDKSINNKLKKKYSISDEYDYVENSIYTTFTKVDVVNKETLLRFHYRCNEKIINFSNQKYYHNKLIVRNKSKVEAPLEFIDTSESDTNDNSFVKNTSEVEARSICEYIKNNPDEKIAVITPFTHQKDCIEYYLEANKITDVPVGTVHSFQGDQKDIIIFSTAISNTTLPQTYAWLKNNRELINVAVSRAKNKLVILGNKKAIKKLSDGQDDLKELVEYVETNGRAKLTDVSPISTALGTRQISTESEKELATTINQVLSVIDQTAYLRSEVAISSVFVETNPKSRLYYSGRFDLVVYRKSFEGEKVVLIVECNGPEHRENVDVIKRDNYKKELCAEHHVKYIEIPRDCVRDYVPIKKTLMSIIKVVK